jgi:hypothetical protein
MADIVVLAATSLEGQVVEALRELQQAEEAWIADGLAQVPPQQRARRLTVNPNFAAGTLAYSLTLPITIADAANGYTMTVNEYLP